jgi:ribosomal protein L18
MPEKVKSISTLYRDSEAEQAKNDGDKHAAKITGYLYGRHPNTRNIKNIQ